MPRPSSQMHEICTIQKPEGGTLALTFADIRALVVRDQKYADDITDAEVILFGQFCQGHMADPRRNDAYLIKYAKKSPAAYVLGIGHFNRVARLDPEYNGCKHGIILLEGKDKGQNLVYRRGTIILEGERLIGGWAEVRMKNQEEPERVELMLEQRQGKVRDEEGRWIVNTQWRKDPAGMIEKCCIAAAKRAACGTVHSAYISEEIDAIAGNVPTAFDQAFRAADVQPEEDEVPTEEEIALIWNQIEERIADSGLVNSFDGGVLREYMAHVREQLNKGAKPDKQQTAEQYLRKALTQLKRSDKDLKRFLEGLAKFNDTAFTWTPEGASVSKKPRPEAEGQPPQQPTPESHPEFMPETVEKVGPEHVDFDQQMRDAIASYDPIGPIFWDDGGLPLIARMFERRGQPVYQVGKVYTDGKFRALTHAVNLPGATDAKKAAELYATEHGFTTTAPWDVGKEEPQRAPEPPQEATSSEPEQEAELEDDISLDGGNDAMLMEFSQRLRSAGKGWLLDAYRDACEMKNADFKAAITNALGNWDFSAGEVFLNEFWQGLSEEEKDAPTAPQGELPF